MGGPWPMKATIHSRPSAVSLKVWLRETTCEVDITRYSAMIPVQSVCSIQRALKCARREFKLYLFTEVYYVTLHTSLVSFVCEWMFQSEINFNGFPLLRSREQRTLCREHVNRNIVHARSSLLTSWLSDSGVLNKRDMQKYAERGVRGLELEPLGYIMCHSPVRKHYSTVSKSTTIPGRKIGLLMFACHSCSICTACVNALMMDRVCANRVRRGMQIHTLTGR